MAHSIFLVVRNRKIAPRLMAVSALKQKVKTEKNKIYRSRGRKIKEIKEEEDRAEI